MSQATSSRLGWCSSKQIQPASPSLEGGPGGPLSRLSTEKRGCYVNLATPLTRPSSSVCCCGMQTCGRAWATQDWPGPTGNSTGIPAPPNCLKSTNKSLAVHQRRGKSGVHHAYPSASPGRIWRRSWCYITLRVHGGFVCHTAVHLFAADPGPVLANSPDASPDYALPFAGSAVRRQTGRRLASFGASGIVLAQRWPRCLSQNFSQSISPWVLHFPLPHVVDGFRHAPSAVAHPALERSVRGLEKHSRDAIPLHRCDSRR